MTRQVAIGAVIAFAATVLFLSVWTPSQAPAPTPPPPAAPAPAQVIVKDPGQLKQMQVRPLPNALVNRALLLKNALPAPLDAGTP